MDNFDLKNYLAKNVLLEQDGKLDDILVQRKDILKTISVTDERELWDFISQHSPLGFEQKKFLIDNWEQIKSGEVKSIPNNWLKSNYPELHDLTDKKIFGGLKNEKELEKAAVDIHNKFFDFIKEKTGSELSIGKSQYNFGGSVEAASDLIQGAADASGEDANGIKQAYIRAKDSITNFRERSKDLFEKISGQELEVDSSAGEDGNSIVDFLISAIVGTTGLLIFRFYRIAKKTVMPWIDSQNAAMRVRKDADQTARMINTEQDSYKNLRNSRWYARWFKMFEGDFNYWKRSKEKNEAVLGETPLLFESLEAGNNKLKRSYRKLFKNVGILALTQPTNALNFVADFLDGELQDNILPAGKKLVEKLPKSKRAREIDNLVKDIDSVEFESVPKDVVNEQEQSENLTGLADKVIASSKNTLEKGLGVEDTSPLSEYISKIREFFSDFVEKASSESEEIIQSLAPSDWAVTLIKWSAAIYSIIVAAIFYAIRVAHKMTRQRGTAGYEKARLEDNKEILKQWGMFRKFFNINKPRTPFDEGKETSLAGVILTEENKDTSLSVNSFLDLLPYFYTDTAAMMNFTNNLKPLATSYVLSLVSFKPKAESIKSFFDGLKDAAVKLESEVEDRSKAKEFVSTL